MILPEKTGKPDFEKKMNRMSKNRLKDVKSIECSNPVIRFQCSYCNSNYARKNNLDTHVKQKHKENLEDKKAKVESPDNNDNQTPVSDVQTTEFDDIEGTKQFDCLFCDNSYAKVETLEKHTSEVHRRKSNVQIEGISLNDQTNDSQPPKAKKTGVESIIIVDNKAIPQIDGRASVSSFGSNENCQEILSSNPLENGNTTPPPIMTIFGEDANNFLDQSVRFPASKELNSDDLMKDSSKGQ